jgi:hypothetical protein
MLTHRVISDVTEEDETYQQTVELLVELKKVSVALLIAMQVGCTNTIPFFRMCLSNWNEHEGSKWQTRRSEALSLDYNAFIRYRQPFFACNSRMYSWL